MAGSGPPDLEVHAEVWRAVAEKRGLGIENTARL